MSITGSACEMLKTMPSTDPLFFRGYLIQVIKYVLSIRRGFYYHSGKDVSSEYHQPQLAQVINL